MSNSRLTRRRFLGLSGAGALACGLTPPWSEAAGQALAAAPPTLRSPQLEVAFDPARGVPSAYHLLTPKGRRRAPLWGDQTGAPLSATICQRAPWRVVSLPLPPPTTHLTANQVEFQFAVTMNGDAGGEPRPAVQFVLRYRLEGATLWITTEQVRESPGYEWIELPLPALVTVWEEDAGWLAHGDAGGSLVRLPEASNGNLAPNRFWGPVLASLPVLMAGVGRAVCVAEVTALMDGGAMRVSGPLGRRRGALGTIQAYRVNGALCQDMNTGPGTPRNCGNAQTPNLLVAQGSCCRLDFLWHAGRGPAWLAGAQLVRARMPAMPQPQYRQQFAYSVLCDLPKLPAAAAPFAQVEEQMHAVAALTDGWPQRVLLWGWQFRGKDTGYPAVDAVDARIGGYDGLRRLITAGPSCNAQVTLADNYDDAYRSSPAWDEALIARRPDGQLWESRNWTGENSYVLGLAKYMRDVGRARVAYTCRRYPLPATLHIDVLSYYPVRNDWDPQHPASGFVNFRDGRCEVLRAFAAHGTDVTSEFLRYAFIGKISDFMNGVAGGRCPFGGQPIPLQAAIYRGSATWGQSGRNRDWLDSVLKTLFYNGRAHFFPHRTASLEEITDYFYLQLLPWFQLNHRDLLNFSGEGPHAVLTLAGNARVEMDWTTRQYAVTLDGAEIARDGAVSCPLDDHRLAFYALTPRPLSAPLPASWRPEEVVARKLSVAGKIPFPLELQAGRMIVQVPERTPVILYRQAALAGQTS